MVVVLILFISLIGGGAPVFSLSQKTTLHGDLCQLLMSIHNEVEEMGFRAQEDFLKREFHLNIDGSTANREEHVVVLCHPHANGEKMILQVTYFGEGARGGISRLSKLTREICCLIEDDTLVILSNAFAEEETRNMLPLILRGIQEEKKILKLLDH
jgi:hypothetical protein